jgi:hypothetical protein
MTEQELQRLRREVAYAALPAKVGVGMATCFGFLVVLMFVVFGLTFAYDAIRGCYSSHPPKACLDDVKEGR